MRSKGARSEIFVDFAAYFNFAQHCFFAYLSNNTNNELSRIMKKIISKK